METTIILILLELLIICGCISLWLAVRSVYQRRKQKRAIELLQLTWVKQQSLYREVLRKRLAALFRVEGEELLIMIDHVLEYEQNFVQQLVGQLAKSFSSPEPQQVIQVVQLINRQGDVYSQLAAGNQN